MRAVSSPVPDSELALDAGAEADGAVVDDPVVVVAEVLVVDVLVVEVLVVTDVDVPTIVVAGTEVATIVVAGADVPAIEVVVPTGADVATGAVVAITVVDDTTVVATTELDGVEMLPHDTAQNAPSLEIEVVLRFKQGIDVVVKLGSSTVQEPVHPAPEQYPMLPVPPRQLTSIEA